MIDIKTSKMLRGLAILIVIASHYAGWMYVEPLHVKAHAFISSLGPIGVDIFFLMSGYGLVKSASLGSKKSDVNNGGITWEYVFKRFTTVYLSYILIVGIINTVQKSWSDMEGKDILHFFTGYEFWYMQVLFIMYIAFMIIWRFGQVMWVRILLITIAIIALTVRLYNIGRADFWELSNVAFLIGIYAATIEHYDINLMKKRITSILLLLVGAIGTVVFYIGMQSFTRLNSGETLSGLYNVMYQSGASWKNPVFTYELIMNIFFTLFVLGVAYLLPTWKGYILTTLGECSLYVYLLHTALFWAIVFKFEDMSYAKAASMTALISIAVSVIVGMIYNTLNHKLIGVLRK